jgi:cobalt-zinc-cadmium resistance protein CzcA
MFIGPLLLLVVAPALRKIFLSRDTQDTAIEPEGDVAVEGNPDG